MKIVYFNPTGVLGGAEMNLLDVLASVRAARPGWRLSVVLGDEGPLREAVESLDLPCRVLPLPRNVARLGDAGLADRSARRAGGLRLAARGPAAALTAAAYLARLRRVFRAEGPDQIQTNGMKAHVLGAWAAPRGVPVVWHLQDYLGARPIMTRLTRLSARPRIAVVALSRSVAEDAARVLGPRVPVRTVYSAIDLGRFAPGPGRGGTLDEASGLAPTPAGTVRVGLVATFARWKGHEVFLDAISRIATDRLCRFYIVGGPIYRSLRSQYALEELREKADALGLGGRLGFTGHQAEPAAVLRALDVVVHASTRPEPFGRVIVEGMACGRAVVAMRAGGAAELFEDGVSALGCPPGDPGALAGALTRLIDNPGLRCRLGEAGRAAALARFDRGRLAKAWAAVYEPDRFQDETTGAGSEAVEALPPGRDDARRDRPAGPAPGAERLAHGNSPRLPSREILPPGPGGHRVARPHPGAGAGRHGDGSPGPLR
jgi:glycosyltransferase involved in cell wall biosynthesis